jgi:hypothetical protein
LFVGRSLGGSARFVDLVAITVSTRTLAHYLTVLGAESSELLASVLLEALEVTVAVMVYPLATLLRGWKANEALPEASVVTPWTPRKTLPSSPPEGLE